MTPQEKYLYRQHYDDLARHTMFFYKRNIRTERLTQEEFSIEVGMAILKDFFEGFGHSVAAGYHFEKADFFSENESDTDHIHGRIKVTEPRLLNHASFKFGRLAAWFIP